MPEPITLRGLQADDRTAIARILAGSGAFRADEVAVGLELVDETLNPGPATDYRWIIAAGPTGDVVGFACFGPVPMTDATWDLYWIAVDRDARGLGVATQLDASVAAEVRGLGGRWLLAETSSTPAYAAARGFYAHRGYAILGRVADFYRPGDDRLTFGKRLDRDCVSEPT